MFPGKNLKNHQIKKILLVNPPQIQTQTLDLETFKNKRYFNYPPYGIGLLKSCINKKNPEFTFIYKNDEVKKIISLGEKSKYISSFINNNFKISPLSKKYNNLEYMGFIYYNYKSNG